MSFLLLLCAFSTCTAWSISIGINIPWPRPEYELEDAALHFEDFMQTYGKRYANEFEKQARFQIFKSNLEEVNRLNQGQDDAVFGLSLFMDLTHEEFLRSYAGLGHNSTDNLRSGACSYVFDEEIQNDFAPPQFDWREFNGVTPVKQQSDCSSCYAFSALANIESQYAIKYRQHLDLSEQQIVDCDRRDGGCGGGYMTNVFRYLIEAGGSVGEQDYLYRGIQGQCRFNPRRVKAGIVDCRSLILNSQEKVKQYLHTYGPISIGIQSSGIRNYMGGLITDARCNVGDVDHAVLLVGYGIARNGAPYWIVKNSWGTNWGDRGYFYMARGDNMRCSVWCQTQKNSTNPSLPVGVVKGDWGLTRVWDAAFSVNHISYTAIANPPAKHGDYGNSPTLGGDLCPAVDDFWLM